MILLICLLCFVSGFGEILLFSCLFSCILFDLSLYPVAVCFVFVVPVSVLILFFCVRGICYVASAFV